jgi:hypothetical protein
MEAIRKSVEKSQALFGGKAVVIGQIWALVNECSEPGWDGDGAGPVDRFAAFKAAEVIRALPARLPLPEVTPEPDGAISLDWIRSRSRVFSLTVGSSARLASAWVDGSDRGYAVVRFDGQVVPNRILQGIDEIMRHGGVTLGPA